MPTTIPSWQWGALSATSDLSAVLAQLNTRMQQLQPVVRDLSTGLGAVAASSGVDLTLRGYFSGNQLATGLASGATIAGMPALTVARASAIDFREPFDSLPDGWTIASGMGTLSIQNTGGVTGGRTLRCTGQVWRVFPYPLAFNPGRLYRLTARVRQVSIAAGESPSVYIGLTGYAADGVTPVNVLGQPSLAQQAYLCVAGYMPPLGTGGDPGWVEVSGWIKGNALATAAGGDQFAHPDPRTPGLLHANVRYIAPLFLLNNGGTSSVAEIDSLELAEYDEVAAARLYAALDSAGRVQTGVNASADIAGRTASTIATAINASGQATAIAPGTVDVSTFAAGLSPVALVSALPTAAGYTGPSVVYNITDGQLYRYASGAWTAAVPATGITGQITTTQITDSAIATPKLAAGAVTTDRIAAGAVTADRIAANAITAGQIQAGAISTTQLAAGAITSDKIAAGQIAGLNAATGVNFTGTLPTGWKTFLDLTATGHTPVLQCATADGATVGFTLYADGAVYINPAYVPSASGTNAFAAGSASVDGTGTVNASYSLDPSAAGATVTATIQLGGSTTTYAMTPGSGNTFTYLLSDYYSGTSSYTRQVRVVFSAAIPGSSTQQRLATTSYKVATANAPL